MKAMNEWIAQAQKLRDEGISYRKISATLGVSSSVVYRTLNPAAAEQAQRYSKEYCEAHREQTRRCGCTALNIAKIIYQNLLREMLRGVL